MLVVVSGHCVRRGVTSPEKNRPIYYYIEMSAKSLGIQICCCLCVFMMFNFARGRAYTPLFMAATLVLCMISSCQTYAIGRTAMSLAMPKKEEEK